MKDSHANSVSMNRMADDIYDKIVKIVGGEMYKDENGEFVSAPEDADDAWYDSHEPVGLIDYLDEAYDIRYTVKGHRGDYEVVGVAFMIACGGPNIYVHEDRVRIHWWGDSAESRRFPGDVEDAILELAREIFSC